MALFDMFKKKECDICGAEIGLLGNRKLEDGNMCKDCAELLSPWFDDRRDSTVDEIKTQLAYRMANRDKVEQFNATYSIGERTKVVIDEGAGEFMVVGPSIRDNNNPDIIPIADVIGCRLDIDEDRTEVRRTDRDGNSVSYVPPRFRYNYNFYIEIQVKHPFFDEIRFKLNDWSVTVEKNGGLDVVAGVGMLLNVFAGAPMQNFSVSPEYDMYYSMGEEIKAALLGDRMRPDPTPAEIVEQVKEKITGTQMQEEEAPVKKVPNFCSNCGAPTTPDAKNFCTNCGAPF